MCQEQTSSLIDRDNSFCFIILSSKCWILCVKCFLASCKPKKESNAIKRCTNMSVRKFTQVFAPYFMMMIKYHQITTPHNHPSRIRFIKSASLLTDFFLTGIDILLLETILFMTLWNTEYLLNDAYLHQTPASMKQTSSFMKGFKNMVHSFVQY